MNWLRENRLGVVITLMVIMLVIQMQRIQKLEEAVTFVENNFDAIDQRTSDLEGEFEDLQAR